MRASRIAAYVATFFALVGLGVACGSTEADSVFSDSGSTEGAGGSKSTSTSSGSSSQGGASMTATVGAGGSTVTSTSADSSSAAESSSMASTGSGGPPPIQVYCKGAPCADGQVCCYNLNDADLDQCGAPGSCDASQGYITIGCNDVEDCPGQACCADFDFQSNEYEGAGCFDQCSAQQLIMCEGHPEVCPQGSQCNASGKLGDGYSYCG